MTATTKQRSQQLSRAEWLGRNREHLDRMVDAIEAHLTEVAAREVHPTRTHHAARFPESDLDPPMALDQLVEAFQLTDFERSLIGLLVAVDLRPIVGELLADIGGGGPRASFAVASRVLADPHWTALNPERPLRSALLIDIGAGPLPTAPLGLAERVLQHLLGVDALADELALSSLAIDGPQLLCPSHEEAALAVVAVWQQTRTWPTVHLDARRALEAIAVAGRVAAQLGWPCSLVRGSDIPTDPSARGRLERVWRREISLAPRVLVVQNDANADTDRRCGPFLDAVIGPVLTIGPRPETLRSQRVVTIQQASVSEQRQLWSDQLDHASGTASCDTIERIVTNFRLGTSDIVEIATQFDGALPLWDHCRARGRSSLDGLAERVESRANWDDLILPADETGALRALAEYVRHRHVVHRAWGLGGERGSGIAALFHGPSGVGKTFAAEVVANEVELDLYRIDLSSIVSKYIGETEKNLRRIFDAAEDSGAILLFDEADALFGKRTEVKESKDRWANIAISYLLTRIETYPGLAILTTNLRSAIDPAFLRRLGFVISFPFPDEAQRKRMWDQVFPPDVPTAGLVSAKLARLGVTGAIIRRIALHATFEAAAEQSVVELNHVRSATQREMAKIDRALSRSEMAVFE